MHLNKIGLLALSMSAVFMATSCNNTVSLKKANEWAKSHFTHKDTEETNLKSVKVTFDGSGTKGDNAIGNLNFIAYLYGAEFDKQTLKGEKSYTKDKIPAEAIYLIWNKYYISGDTFVATHSEEIVKKQNMTFSLKNNQLTESSSYDAKETGEYSGGKIKQQTRYNKDGARLYVSNKVENGTVLSYPDEVVNVSIVVTIKY